MPSSRRARARLARAAALLAVALGAGGCAGWPESRAAETCQPRFPYEGGWLGGDAAYSVPLPGGETLWLFGDTFVGEPGRLDRTGSTFIHNSIALSRCRSGRWEIEYHWGTADDGQPIAFLHRESKDGWWWLFDGFLHEGRLYVGLLAVERSPPRGVLALPFRFSGMELARIDNPDDDPAHWRVERLPLSTDPVALPASAMVVEGAYLYLFTFLDRSDGRLPRGLARLPLTALAEDPPEPGRSLEFLATDGRWKPGLDADDALVLMADNATEMSVDYREDLDRWLALYSYPGRTGEPRERGFSEGVFVRTATQIEGPWSEPRLLFRVPELDPRYVGGYDPDTACYAAKEHPQFSTEDGVTFTYVCNLFTPPGQDPFDVLRRLLVDMNLYRPNAVSVPLPVDLRER